jgi:hypothetical protein
MAKQTIEQRMITGLVVLGFKPLATRGSRYKVFSRDDATGKFFYVGKNGALRIGRTAADSIPAAELTKQYVLTAPHTRPLVFAMLEGIAPLGNADPLATALYIQEREPRLADIPTRAIANHVKAWSKLQNAPLDA